MLLIIVKAPWGHIRLFGQPKNFQLSQKYHKFKRTQVKSKCCNEKVTMEGCLSWTTLQILFVKGEGRTSFLSKTINDLLILKCYYLWIKMRSSVNVITIPRGQNSHYQILISIPPPIKQANRISIFEKSIGKVSTNPDTALRWWNYWNIKQRPEVRRLFSHYSSVLWAVTEQVYYVLSIL